MFELMTLCTVHLSFFPSLPGRGMENEEEWNLTDLSTEIQKYKEYKQPRKIKAFSTRRFFKGMESQQEGEDERERLRVEDWESE